MSILHRITGFGLALGTVLVTGWLLAAISGQPAFDAFQDLTHAFIGRLMLFCWVFAMTYHFLNGIRHLVQDSGRWMSLKNAYASGWTVFIGSLVLSVLIWFSA